MGQKKAVAGQVQLPKDALKRVQLGQSFAEYDLVRNEPSLFVVTVPVAVAVNDTSGAKSFFVGRRGTGKTATTYFLTRERKNVTGQLHPQIFELRSLKINPEWHRDTRQRPFRTLQLAFERTLMCEAVRFWLERKMVKVVDLPPALTRERNFIEDYDFDQRFLHFLQELEDALEKDKEWLKIVRRVTHDLPLAMQSLVDDSKRSLEAVLILDRIDEAWDGTERAVILLTALMHACVVVTAECSAVQPKLFLRENIFDRVRAIDNEFARLETSVVSMDWSEEQLVEMVERRLNLPFNTKLPLRGPTWDYFFPSSGGESTRTVVFDYCQHRPRDVLTYCAFAIESATGHGHERVYADDLLAARQRFSDSRLKDLGDEYAENFPSINLVLSRFFGLGQEFTLNGIEEFIKKLLVDEHVKNYCQTWIYRHSDVESFGHLLYNIGFLGINNGGAVVYRSAGAKAPVPPNLSSGTKITIHPSYAAALALQNIIIGSLDDSTKLRESGVVEELPFALNIDTYKDRLAVLQEDLKTLPTGDKHATNFEDLVGEAIQLCFFRSLANVTSQERTSDGRVRRDWIASNRAHYGFWERVRSLYGAGQVLWECKNYADLQPGDFNQFGAYMTKAIGRFLICSYRGEEKPHYFEHIRRILAEKHPDPAMVLLLTDKDLQVFMRQAMNGKTKEDHLEDILDRVVRKVS